MTGRSQPWGDGGGMPHPGPKAGVNLVCFAEKKEGPRAKECGGKGGGGLRCGEVLSRAYQVGLEDGFYSKALGTLWPGCRGEIGRKRKKRGQLGHHCGGPGERVVAVRMERMS